MQTTAGTRLTMGPLNPVTTPHSVLHMGQGEGGGSELQLGWSGPQKRGYAPCIGQGTLQAQREVALSTAQSPGSPALAVTH